jgi:RNA polymerase sigma-70 factor, ECF subfamily
MANRNNGGDSNKPPPDETQSPKSVDVEAFRTDLVALIPFLRAFAHTLCGRREEADDLCQEALAKAWQARETFEAGTNLKAWLFVILRNQFYSEKRHAWRQRPWDQGVADQTLVTYGEQQSALNLSDLARTLRQLPDEQREALILVGAGGFSYEESAAICKCPVGTIKSRVARARATLAQALETKLPDTLTRTPVRTATDEILSQLDKLVPDAGGANAGKVAPSAREANDDDADGGDEEDAPRWRRDQVSVKSGYR